MSGIVGPPPKMITLLGKEYYEAESMKQHLRDLREKIARTEMDRDYWKLQAVGPR
jgi:hypothetical protein